MGADTGPSPLRHSKPWLPTNPHRILRIPGSRHTSFPRHPTPVAIGNRGPRLQARRSVAARGARAQVVEEAGGHAGRSPGGRSRCPARRGRGVGPRPQNPDPPAPGPGRLSQPRGPVRAVQPDSTCHLRAAGRSRAEATCTSRAGLGALGKLRGQEGSSRPLGSKASTPHPAPSSTAAPLSLLPVSPEKGGRRQGDGCSSIPAQAPRRSVLQTPGMQEPQDLRDQAPEEFLDI